MGHSIPLKMINKIITLIGMILAIIPLISTFGVSTPYYDNNPLIMDKGETKIVNLNLQNMVGEDDVSVLAELISGSEIASLGETQFDVKIGTHDTYAPIEIKIPRDFPEGTTNRISVQFKTLSKQGEGMVAIGTGMTISFDVITSGETAKRNIPWTPIISIFILLLVILIIFLHRRRSKIVENQKQLVNSKQALST